jgi:hypothetical protein
MVEKVRPRHIKNYIEETYNTSIDRVNNSDKLFEALSESIVNLNKEYEAENLIEQYESSDLNPRGFAQKKFEEVVHQDTLKIISLAHKNSWIDYTTQLIEEYTNN